MNKTIILATSNINKINEFKAFFDSKDCKIFSFKQSEFSIDDSVEDGTTFMDNAIKKAEYISKKYNHSFPVLAEDSGLCINSLSGFPGINSSRFSLGDRNNYNEKNDHIISLMEDKQDKSAYFICCFAYIDEDKKLHKFEFKVDGLIKKNNKSTKQGFGYDPIFYYEKFDKFFSDLIMEEKNRISHRGKALNAFFDFLMGQKKHHTQ